MFPYDRQITDRHPIRVSSSLIRTLNQFPGSIISHGLASLTFLGHPDLSDLGRSVSMRWVLSNQFSIHSVCVVLASSWLCVRLYCRQVKPGIDDSKLIASFMGRYKVR